MEKYHGKIAKYQKKCDCDKNNILYKQKLEHYQVLAGGIGPFVQQQKKIFEQKSSTQSDKPVQVPTQAPNYNSLIELEKLSKQRTDQMGLIFNNINTIIKDLNACLCKEQEKQSKTQQQVVEVTKIKDTTDNELKKMQQKADELQANVKNIEKKVADQSKVIEELIKIVKSSGNLNVDNFKVLENLCVNDSCKDTNFKKQYSELTKNITSFNDINKSIQNKQFNIVGGNSRVNHRHSFIKI